ncbi:TPR (predicted), partial [Pycnogonum litorale]
YREKRLQQELKLANKQIDLSNAQINEKNQQLANITSEKVSEIFRLQNQVETNVDELKLSEEKVSNLTKMLEKQEKLGDSKNEQLQTLQKNSGQVEADYQHELRAQRKLADLYKKSNDDHECKVRELMKAVEELQKFIEQASFDHSELEGKYNTMVEQYEERLKEASKQIEDLNSELETANKLLSSSVSDGQVSEPSTSVADLYPEAVATSKVLRSYKSLTSLYSDFQRTEQELLKQKQENEELKQYLNNVLQEFDEKAPLLAQQKEDYEKALVTISVLNMKLDQAITDREQAYRERNNELRSAKFVTRENDRLKQKTTDLSSQVCLLLKEIEIYRGNYVPEDDQEVTSSCPSTIADESASSIIISKHLVSFRNIEELQKQNQQLLAVVRELSDEQEAKEKSAVDSRTSDLMTDLEAVKNQVGELKASRSRQETILESVVKQRDMYKTLLTETGPKQSSDEEVLNSKSLKDRSKEIDELNLTIQIMKEEGKRYKQDKDENFRILSEQMEAVRTELFETKLDNGRLTTQLQFSSERIEVLQTRLEASKKEVEMLQEKNNKLSTSVAKHEEVINCVKKEMLTIQSNLSRLEVSHQNLQSEHNLVKNREECLVQERDALMKERQSQGHILSNLQLLQANLERVEAERKLQMTNQIEKLEKDNEALRKKLDVERDEYKTAVDVWQKRNEEIRKQLDEALNSGQNRNSEHYKTLSELNELKNKLKEMESRSHSEDGTTKPLILSSRIETPSDRQRIESEQNESSINEMEDLKRSLSQADNRVKELASESDQKGEHLTHMTELTCQLETRLKETVEASDKVKKELQAKIDGISNQNAKYDDKINELLTKNEALTKKVEELNRISKSKDKDSKTVVDDLKIRFETATKDLQAEKLKLKQLTNDAEQQLKAASETEEKYKQVVLNHAKDLKLLNETETQLSSSNEIIAKAREAAQVAEQQLEGSRKSWKQQESMLVGNCEELSSKVKELENQNKLLYEQIELMNTQIMSLRSADHSSSSLDTSLTGDGNKNSNQLLEVVRYLRKEKDVQATQCEVLKAESVRLQTQLQHANKQLEAVEKQLFDARKRAEGNEAAVMSASKHRELIKKVEMLNLLSESNTTLRQQKQDAEDKIKELLGKVEQIERKVFQYQSMMNDIISQKDSAASENVALRNEIKRWQVRVEQLTEQANKITPEDLKKLNEELETLRKNVESLKKEGQRKAAEMSELRTLYESAKTEVNSLKEKVAADEKRIKELSDAIANKAVEKELADKKKLIVQVKSIAKKYKEHYQEAQNKNKDLEESIAESQSNSKQLQERIIRLEMQKNELEEA